ncbi:MAG: malate dehydrogenase [Granulosicoccus sp.]|jgi:malate dehydrogenase
MCAQRVIGSEFVEQARQRGLVTLEVLPGDIVTAVAHESANRLGIKLLDGPLEKPAVPRTDGNTSARRALYRRSPKWMAPSKLSAKSAQRLVKISIVGAGGVGSTLAHLAVQANIATEIVLSDIVPGVAEAAALDLNHCNGITRTRARVVGTTDLSQIAGSHVVIVTAGRARTPGMSRTDLVNTNKRVIHSVGEIIKTQAPNAIVIVITNPLDEMTLEMLRCTGFPRERVMGMAGTLDSSRFKHSLALAANVDPGDVSAMALGNHGDEMVPVTSLATIKGQALDKFLSTEAIAECVQDAITGGGQVVALKKTGSAIYAPAHSAIELLEHIRGAKTGPVPVSVLLQGEYGISDVVLGVPAHIGLGGLLEVEQLPLSKGELAALHNAAAAIQTRMVIA